MRRHYRYRCAKSEAGQRKDTKKSFITPYCTQVRGYKKQEQLSISRQYTRSPKHKQVLREIRKLKVYGQDRSSASSLPLNNAKRHLANLLFLYFLSTLLPYPEQMQSCLLNRYPHWIISPPMHLTLFEEVPFLKIYIIECHKDLGTQRRTKDVLDTSISQAQVPLTCTLDLRKYHQKTLLF